MTGNIETRKLIAKYKTFIVVNMYIYTLRDKFII